MEPFTHQRTTALRRFLSHWGPWMVVAYMGLVAITVSGFILNGKVVKRQATHAAAVQRCLTNRPTLIKFSVHLRGVSKLADTLVVNSMLVYQATPDTDPAKAVRRSNLARLVQARADIGQVKSIPVPTVAECKALP